MDLLAPVGDRHRLRVVHISPTASRAIPAAVPPNAKLTFDVDCSRSSDGAGRRPRPIVCLKPPSHSPNHC